MGRVIITTPAKNIVLILLHIKATDPCAATYILFYAIQVGSLATQGFADLHVIFSLYIENIYSLTEELFL